MAYRFRRISEETFAGDIEFEQAVHDYNYYKQVGKRVALRMEGGGVSFVRVVHNLKNDNELEIYIAEYPANTRNSKAPTLYARDKVPEYYGELVDRLIELVG